MEKGYPKVVWLFVFVCVQKGGLAEPEPESPAPPRTPAPIGRRRLPGAPPASTRAAPGAPAPGGGGVVRAARPPTFAAGPQPPARARRLPHLRPLAFTFSVPSLPLLAFSPSETRPGPRATL